MEGTGRGREVEGAGRRPDLAEKVYAGERLTRADGEALCAGDDLVWLGGLAQRRRTDRHADRVLVELTAGEPVPAPESYPDLLRELSVAQPDGVPVVVTATDVRRFATATGRFVEEILDELVDAGLGGLAGGDLEIVEPDGGQSASGWADWSRIHRAAHRRGLRTVATMRHGRAEQPGQRIDQLLRIRELQDETGGFITFVPLRHPYDGVTPAPSPAESLKTFAVARLLLDNVPHVRASWAAYGLSTAQLALNFGADELAGSLAEYRLLHTDGDHPAPATPDREELLDLVWDAGFRPVERDARYTVVREYEAPVPLAQRRAEPQRIWA
ncbi:aminofutalosine synthase MqnE [Plantactinospora sp. B5E13]|uniref:aminofutalosine synthase MqnE n=1 Tax=Plantactinospora sp. B5E13 TaxID=3153758 RepID=UPI00325CDE76